MSDILSWVFVSLGIIVLAYAVVRVGSFAYFKTKYEYLRATMKEMRKGDNDDGV